MDKKQKTAIVTIVLLSILALSFLAYLSLNSEGTVNGLNAEAGIIREDGTIIPLDSTNELAVWTVNNVNIGENDWFYAKFWLILKAGGLQSQTSAVRFVLTQTWQGTEEASQQFGTTTNGKPVTSTTESWFITSLPVNQNVIVPLKYRDNPIGFVGEPTVPAPFSIYDSVSGNMIREARLLQCRFLDTPVDGTYTLTLSGTVLGVDYTHGTVNPSPNTVSFTFTITKTTGTLTANVNGSTG